MWYDSLIPSPESYEEFVKCFRQQFWSIDIQRRVYDDVVRPYQYRSPTGLATHAIMWIAKAKYLDPPIHQLSLVSTIILFRILRQNIPYSNNPRPNNQPQYHQPRENGNSQQNRGRFHNNNRRFDDSRNNHPRQTPRSPQQPRVQQLDVSENENGSLQ